jgi:hypothetical protein
MAKVRVSVGSADFYEKLEDFYTELGMQVSKDVLQEFLETATDKMRENIEDERVSTLPSESGYYPGALGKSIKYRIMMPRSRKDRRMRGYISVGEGLPYAQVHDREVDTTIEGNPLVFYWHKEGEKRWIQTYSVVRPGKPFTAKAIEYALERLYS